jgi:prepilin-type N-terminal cleavage/methylation domain-containing protein
MKTLKTSGFSLIELLLAISVFSVVSVAAMSMLFSSLSLRDQTIASSQTEEAIRVFNHSLGRAGRNAQTVAGGGSSLYIVNSQECWSFVWNPVSRSLLYDHTMAAGCSPNTAPTISFFPTNITVNSIDFIIKSLPSGGREIYVSGDMTAWRPFSNYQTDFDLTIVGLVD